MYEKQLEKLLLRLFGGGPTAILRRVGYGLVVAAILIGLYIILLPLQNPRPLSTEGSPLRNCILAHVDATGEWPKTEQEVLGCLSQSGHASSFSRTTLKLIAVQTERGPGGITLEKAVYAEQGIGLVQELRVYREIDSSAPNRRGSALQRD